MGPKAAGRKEKLAAKAAKLEVKKREQEEKEEQERQEREREAQQEREREAKRKEEETEILEKSIRDVVLLETCDHFQDLGEKNLKHLLEMRMDIEWERYLACDRLPYPEDVPSMNTYLYSWSTSEEARMELVLEKNEAMIRLMSLLEGYIQEPLDATEEKQCNWREVRRNYRAEMKNKLDLACFHMIRNVEERFNKINYWEYEFEKGSENIHLWMWIWKSKTIKSSAIKSAPSKSLGTISIKLPVSFSDFLLVLRLIYTTFDHYTDQSRTWDEPKNPVDHDLYDETVMWHEIKLEIIADNFETLLQADEIPCWYEIPEEEFSMQNDISELSESCDRTIKEKQNLLGVQEECSYWKKSKFMGEKHKKEFLEEIVNNKGKPSEKLKQDMSVTIESDPQSNNVDNIYIGTQPIPGKQEVYRITSEGKINIARTDEQLKLEPEEDDWNTEKEFADWVSLADSTEVDDMDVFELLYNGGKFSSCINDGPESRLRTLPEMLREVEPRTGRLAELNLPADLRKSLSEILEINIERGKNRYVEDQLDERTPIKTLSQHMEDAKVRYMEAYKNELKLNVSEKELNLRKYIILGGVYNIDLIKQIPQPHKHKDGTKVQINYGDYNISKEDFYFRYVPPIVTEEEDNEDEDGKPKADDDIDKLISVEIQVSDTVLWFETPAPYLWEEGEQLWSSENIYDVRFNEEKQILSFRIGKTSTIGIASYRFYNLPYQTWDIHPAADWNESRSIIFSLTASTVVVEFKIQADKVTLNSVQNATGGALDRILGIAYPPNQLIRIMRMAGLDLFPGWDAFLYVEGNSAKNKVLEEHVYMCMALMAASCQYTWSRWNLPVGQGGVVLQVRESSRPPGSYGTVLCRARGAAAVRCTEVSPAFSEEPAADFGFQPDLLGLIKATVSDRARKMAASASNDLTFTLYYMLLQTKIFSFS